MFGNMIIVSQDLPASCGQQTAITDDFQESNIVLVMQCIVRYLAKVFPDRQTTLHNFSNETLEHDWNVDVWNKKDLSTVDSITWEKFQSIIT